MLKGAIFDLGGTLMHLAVSWEQIRDDRLRAIRDVLRDNGVQVDLDDLKREYTKLHDEEAEYADRTLEEIEIGRTLSRLLGRLGVEARHRPAMIDLVKKFFALELDSWVIFPGVHEMLAEVRGLRLKMGLLSNARSDWAVREIMDRLNLTRYFDVILTSAAVGFRKPRPEPFRQMLRSLALEPNEVVMIGNSREADISGAGRLSIKTIQVIYGNDEDDDEGPDPDMTVSAVPEIVQAIKSIAAGSQSPLTKPKYAALSE